MSRIRDLMGTGNSAGSAKAIAGTHGTLAAAGTSSQANSTMASYETNYVTVGGATANGVVLPTSAQGSQPGDSCTIFNLSSTACLVYPGGSETANGSTSAISVAQNKMLILKRVVSTGWGYIVTA